jgi:hypothetical protein
LAFPGAMAHWTWTDLGHFRVVLFFVAY